MSKEDHNHNNEEHNSKHGHDGHHHEYMHHEEDGQGSEHAHHHEEGSHGGGNEARNDHVHHGHDAHDAHSNHHDHGNHDHAHHHHHGNFKELFLKSLPLGIIIMVLSPMMGITLPLQFTFQYSDLITAALATILLLYGGRPFYQGALDEFRQRAPGMMALVSLGLSVSYVYSIYAVLARYTTGEHVMDFFFEFASLILIMLLGHWIEMKAVGDAGDAQQALAELVPKDAQVVLEHGEMVTRKVSELQPGDMIRVQAGENIPADGVITQGSSRVNEALLTGEAKPVARAVGDKVIGGSTNQEGALLIEVEEIGEKSFIAQVQSLIAQAQNQPSRAENMAQKVAGWLFYIAVATALLAFVAWLILGDLPTAVSYTVTTLVIACPHALGLAIPLVVARSTSLGAGRGLLVKDRAALEQANKADVMVLDKTGTLTTGEFKVLAIEVLAESHTKNDILAIMAGIEAGSSHPIAQSLVAHAKAEQVEPLAFDRIDVVAGAGVKGDARGQAYQLLSEKAWGENLQLETPAGATLSVLTENDRVIGAVALGDELKASSRELIATLKAKNIQPLMATGDNETAAQGVAAELGIDYRANQSPEDKYQLVEELTAADKTVIMVGDGVNDAPSLALADVGIAVGAGTQVALDSADIILTQSEPADINSFLELSAKTTRKMKENLVWGAGYNFIALPLAAGILAPIGFSLSPAVGAILMSLSTIIVALNAMTLRLDEPK